MKITRATFYLIETESQLRQVRFADRGFMDKVPPGLSGLFTNCEGIHPVQDSQIEFNADTPTPMYNLQLRLHTDGGLDAYADWSSGYSAGERALLHDLQAAFVLPPVLLPRLRLLLRLALRFLLLRGKKRISEPWEDELRKLYMWQTIHWAGWAHRESRGATGSVSMSQGITTLDCDGSGEVSTGRIHTTLYW